VRAQERLLLCVTDPSVGAVEALGLGADDTLQPAQLQQLLALRGLLACDLLLHGLQHRHLVNYGRNRWAGGCRHARWQNSDPPAASAPHVNTSPPVQ
jgi:hypothetical protein